MIQELRSYQVEGSAFLVATGRALLADEMGVGKTPQAIDALRKLGAGCSLIVCPMHLELNWLLEFQQWWPEASVVIYSGTARERERAWGRWEQLKAPAAMITHPAQLKVVCKMHWGAMVVDEAHRLRNKKTQGWKLTSRMRQQVLFLLTGTPMIKGARDFIPLLMLLDPRKFSSYWRLVERYFLEERVGPNGIGRAVGQLADPAGFRELLKPYMLRRKLKTVLPNIPDKLRRPLWIAMGDEQQALYNSLRDEMLAEFPDGKLLLTPTTIAKLTRLRQILVHPALVGSPAPSAAFLSLRSWLEERVDAGEKSVVFCMFPSAFPLFQELLTKMHLDSVYVRGTTMTPAAVTEAYTSFQSNPKIKVAVCSLKMSVGFHLSAAHRAAILSPDYLAATNEQAENRLYRFGQDKITMFDYFLHKGTVEEEIIDIVNGRAREANAVLR